MKFTRNICQFLTVLLLCSSACLDQAQSGASYPNGSPGVVARPASVFWIRGGPFNNPSETGFSAQNAVRRILFDIHPEISFSSLHNNDSSELCEELKARKSSGEDFGRLVIIGHSYGGSAGTKLAKCLAEVHQSVSLFLSLDIIRRLVDSNPSIIPDNVVRNLNFYQTDDSFLRGQQENRRVDGASDGILNSKIEMSDSSDPHHLLPNRLVELGWMKQILYDELADIR